MTKVDSVTKPVMDSVTIPNMDSVTKPDINFVTKADIDCVTKPDKDSVTRSDTDSVTQPDMNCVIKPEMDSESTSIRQTKNEEQEDEPCIIIIDLDLEKSAEDLVYEWDSKVKKKFKSCIIADSEKSLDNLMKWYIQTIKEESLNFEDLRNLKIVTAKHLTFIKQYFSELNCCFVDNYLENMEEILSFYVNLEVKSPSITPNGGKKNSFKKLASHIILLLNIYLYYREDRIAHVLMKVKLNLDSEESKALLNYIFRIFLTKEPVEKSDLEFCRAYILYQKWKVIRKQNDWKTMDEIMYKLHDKKLEDITSNSALNQILVPQNISILNAQLSEKHLIMTDQYFRYLKCRRLEEDDSVMIAMNDIDIQDNIGDLHNDAEDQIREEALYRKFVKAMCSTSTDLDDSKERVSSTVDGYSTDEDCQIVATSSLGANPEDENMVHEILDDDDDEMEIIYVGKETKQQNPPDWGVRENASHTLSDSHKPADSNDTSMDTVPAATSTGSVEDLGKKYNLIETSIDNPEINQMGISHNPSVDMTNTKVVADTPETKSISEVKQSVSEISEIFVDMENILEETKPEPDVSLESNHVSSKTNNVMSIEILTEKLSVDDIDHVTLPSSKEQTDQDHVHVQNYYYSDKIDNYMVENIRLIADVESNQGTKKKKNIMTIKIPTEKLYVDTEYETLSSPKEQSKPDHNCQDDYYSTEITNCILEDTRRVNDVSLQPSKENTMSIEILSEKSYVSSPKEQSEQDICQDQYYSPKVKNCILKEIRPVVDVSLASNNENVLSIEISTEESYEETDNDKLPLSNDQDEQDHIPQDHYYSAEVANCIIQETSPVAVVLLDSSHVSNKDNVVSIEIPTVKSYVDTDHDKLSSSDEQTEEDVCQDHYYSTKINNCTTKEHTDVDDSLEEQTEDNNNDSDSKSAKILRDLSEFLIPSKRHSTESNTSIFNNQNGYADISSTTGDILCVETEVQHFNEGSCDKELYSEDQLHYYQKCEIEGTSVTSERCCSDEYDKYSACSEGEEFVDYENVTSSNQKDEDNYIVVDDEAELIASMEKLGAHPCNNLRNDGNNEGSLRKVMYTSDSKVMSPSGIDYSQYKEMNEMFCGPISKINECINPDTNFDLFNSNSNAFSESSEIVNSSPHNDISSSTSEAVIDLKDYRTTNYKINLNHKSYMEDVFFKQPSPLPASIMSENNNSDLADVMFPKAVSPNMQQISPHSNIEIQSFAGSNEEEQPRSRSEKRPHVAETFIESQDCAASQPDQNNQSYLDGLLKSSSESQLRKRIKLQNSSSLGSLEQYNVSVMGIYVQVRLCIAVEAFSESEINQWLRMSEMSRSRLEEPNQYASQTTNAHYYCKFSINFQEVVKSEPETYRDWISNSVIQLISSEVNEKENVVMDDDDNDFRKIYYSCSNPHCNSVITDVSKLKIFYPNKEENKFKYVNSIYLCVKCNPFRYRENFDVAQQPAVVPEVEEFERMVLQSGNSVNKESYYAAEPRSLPDDTNLPIKKRILSNTKIEDEKYEDILLMQAAIQRRANLNTVEQKGRRIYPALHMKSIAEFIPEPEPQYRVFKTAAERKEMPSTSAHHPPSVEVLPTPPQQTEIFPIPQMHASSVAMSHIPQMHTTPIGMSRDPRLQRRSLEMPRIPQLHTSSVEKSSTIVTGQYSNHPYTESDVNYLMNNVPYPLFPRIPSSYVPSPAYPINNTTINMSLTVPPQPAHQPAPVVQDRAYRQKSGKRGRGRKKKS